MILFYFVFCYQFTREVIKVSQLDKSQMEALPQAGLFLAAFDIPFPRLTESSDSPEAHSGKKVSRPKLPALLLLFHL